MRDVEALQSWWTGLRADIPPETRALWFGITDLVVPDDAERSRRTLYVAGCPAFDPDDPECDWAADEYCWWPTGRYVNLTDFESLPDRRREEVVDVLAYAVELVRTLDLSGPPHLEGAAVGFDDGDSVLLDLGR